MEARLRTEGKKFAAQNEQHTERNETGRQDLQKLQNYYKPG